MFQKKDYVFHESLGVCRVADVTKLSSNKIDQVMYYVLRPEYASISVSYVPVDGHKTKLRELVSYEEAEQFVKSVKDEESIEYKEAMFVINRHKEAA